GTASAGVATVDGAGSTWTNSGSFAVGSGGTGSLSITNGGSVSSGISTLGSSPSGDGTVIVDGTGSTWTPTSLYVGGTNLGPQGTGLLRILNGGTVNSGGTTIWSTGTLEIGMNPTLTGTLTFDGGTLRTIADTFFSNNVTIASGGMIVD